MNHDSINEELSAYLDGEASDPAAMARILAQDPEVARRYAQMSALSTRLRSLPAPEVPPAFATRVLAHVREDAEGVRTSWFSPRRLAWGLAGAGFIVVLGVSVLLFVRSGPPAHEQEANPMMASLQDLGFDSMPPDMPPPEYGEIYTVAPEVEYEGTLASIEWLEQEEDAYTATADLDTMLGSLSDAEIQAFKTLLADYAEGSRSI